MQLTVFSHYKNKDFFVSHMCMEELGLMPPDDDGPTPLKQGLVMFTAFIVCGLVPLLAYLALGTTDLSSNGLFGIACGLTAVMLFALGAFSSKFTTSSWWARCVHPARLASPAGPDP